jgi:hypothetical protein
VNELRQSWDVRLPLDSPLRKVTRLPIIAVSLEEEPGRAVARVDKDARVARLARIPFAGLSVGEEGPITHPLPRKSVLTERDAYLLRLVVVSAGIEHDIGVATQADRGRFNAVSFPRQLRFENALRAPLPPMLCGKIARKRRAVNAEHLNLELWIARRPIAEQFIPDDVGFGIDRGRSSSRRRGAIWDCRQIVRMSHHHNSWRGRSRREGPYRSLVKEVNPVTQHNRATRAETPGLSIAIRLKYSNGSQFNRSSLVAMAWPHRSSPRSGGIEKYIR